MTKSKGIQQRQFSTPEFVAKGLQLCVTTDRNTQGWTDQEIREAASSLGPEYSQYSARQLRHAWTNLRKRGLLSKVARQDYRRAMDS